MSKRFQDGAKSSRRKRRYISTYYVDVTAYLDYTCYSRFLKDALYDEVETLKKIQEYYAFIFSGIDLIYQNFEANNVRPRVNLNKVLIFKSSASFKLVYLFSLSNEIDTMSVLNNFTTFLNSTDGRDFSFPYDHAMLFVGSDLWTEKGDILGLAWVETLCRTDGYSSSVIEDMGDYSAIIPAAHELGHSLAANHDGINNTCTYEDRYLMAPSLSAPTDITRQHPWRFSNCSVAPISYYVTTLSLTPDGQTCLSDALSVVGDLPDVSNRLLGQEYPP
ncbi:Metalloprotease mig-17 [Bulinus truncatus]|nr:Metalloprotease mig-17 [Bulinus truncatus]